MKLTRFWGTLAQEPSQGRELLTALWALVGHEVGRVANAPCARLQRGSRKIVVSRAATRHTGRKVQPTIESAETPMLGHVFVLDPPDDRLGNLCGALGEKLSDTCPVEGVRTFNDLEKRLTNRTDTMLAVVHTDAGDGRRDGLSLIRELRKNWPELLLAAVADEGGVELAAAAVAAGANDFLVCGERLADRITTLLAKLEGLVALLDSKRALNQHNAELQEVIGARFHIVGQSDKIVQLVQHIERVARVPRPLLITGERGTGKELVARAVHQAAGDSSRPFVTVNCAAFSDALLESELFGHERGAFTGADEARSGKFELADGGFLFLDEIGHMSRAFQQKILRVVEYGAFHRVGGHREQSTSARVIAATNADLKARMRSGDFLSDLYDRLAFDVLHVPPLRERPADVEVLARHFLNQFAREIPAFRGKKLAESALSVLNRYSFPGNVRELKNIIERAAYRDTTNEITPEDIGMLAEEFEAMAHGTYQERVDAYSRRLIDDALRRSAGNQAQAARSLGLTYDQYRYYLKKFGSKRSV